MTTIAFSSGILVADTRITVTETNPGTKTVKTWYYKTNKIRVTPSFAATGAGSSYFHAMIQYIPFILFLRAFGWIAFPFFGSKNSLTETQNFIVIWRNGSIWTFDVTTEKIGWFMFCRVKNKFLAKNSKNVSLFCGSGAEYISYDMLKNLGPELTVIEAAKKDIWTNDDLCVFDVVEWRYKKEQGIHVNYKQQFYLSVLGTAFFDTSRPADSIETLVEAR